MYRCATKVLCVIRTGTCSPGRAPKSGCIGLHLILSTIQNTVTNRRCAMSHSNTPPVKKLSPLTTRSSSCRCVSAAERHIAEQYTKYQNWQAKTPKASPKNQLKKNLCQYRQHMQSLLYTKSRTCIEFSDG